MNRSKLDAYAAGAAKLGASLQGLTDAELRAHPVPGKWSCAELAAHMMDSEMISIERMRRIIAEDKPLLMAYDENKFIDALKYNDTDPRLCAEIFRLVRQMNTATLRALPDEAFARQGVHQERGLISLEALVDLYIWHIDHHLKFLHEKRAALGKPL